jgi:hypothetical protein
VYLDDAKQFVEDLSRAAAEGNWEAYEQIYCTLAAESAAMIIAPFAQHMARLRSEQAAHAENQEYDGCGPRDGAQSESPRTDSLELGGACLSETDREGEKER